MSIVVTAVVFTAFLGVATLSSSGADPAATGSKGPGPNFDAKGNLLRPVGFERWIVVGTSLGVSYSEESHQEPGTFHSVYLAPEAFDQFVSKGEFPDGTMLVMTNNPATRHKGDEVISRHGHFAGETEGLEVAVKDSKRFDDTWAYFIFHGGEEPGQTAKPFDRESCYSCHAEHAGEDNVFVQFYSVLRAARAKALAEKK